jgi:hypothetical protein
MQRHFVIRFLKALATGKKTRIPGRAAFARSNAGGAEINCGKFLISGEITAAPAIAGFLKTLKNYLSRATTFNPPI